MRTFGPAYDEQLDGARILKQHQVILAVMSSGKWWTLAELEFLTHFPQASISAQLRHLRKPAFGSYTVEKQRRGEGGTWEYRVVGLAKPEQLALGMGGF
jgi:hypothetical protein